MSKPTDRPTRPARESLRDRRQREDVLRIQQFLGDEILSTKKTVQRAYYLLILLTIVLFSYIMLYMLVQARGTFITWLAVCGLIAFGGWQVYTLESSRRYAARIVNWYLATQAVYHEKLATTRAGKNNHENRPLKDMPTSDTGLDRK